MLPYRGCGYTLQIVCTVLVMVVTGLLHQERQPVGPEMCKDHCRQFTECKSCVFFIKRLACIASSSKYPLQTHGEEGVYLHKTKERLGPISQGNEVCTERQSWIVRSRSSGFRCIKLRSKERTPNVRTEDMTRVFVAPYLNTSKMPLRVFHLMNSSITTYMYDHIKIRSVLSMAYVPKLQTLLIGSNMPWNIAAFSLRTEVIASVRTDIYAMSMAVDDAKQLVFLTAWGAPTCIKSMTPDGKYLNKIKCRIKPRVICLDTRRDIVYYINVARSIFSVTYHGKRMKRVALAYEVPGLALTCLTLGDNGDVIYYNDRNNIMKLELYKHKRGRRVTKLLHFPVRNILFNKGNLYISYAKTKDIHVWRQSEYSRLREAYDTGVSGQIIALIP